MSFSFQMKDSYKPKSIVESSWTKLENIFSTRGTSESSTKKSRSKSTDNSKKRKNPYFISDFRNQSTTRSNNISPLRRKIITNDNRDISTSRPTSLSVSSLYPKVYNSPVKLSVPGLSTLQLHRIYEARCKDLLIPVLLDQERIFFNFCLKHFKNRRFELNESGIGVESAIAIGEILLNNEEFAYLELAKNKMGDEGAIELTKLICKNRFLVHLDMSSNDISPEGASTVINLIADHPTIVSLNLSSNEALHRNRLGVLGAIAIQKALQSSILGFINISGTSLGNDGLVYIIEGLRNNQSLVSLNLSNNGLGTEGLDKLSQSISTSSLRMLGFSQNRIGNDGCSYISSLLAGNYDGPCPLESLDISKNEIGTKGLAKLFFSLKGNTQLHTLNLEKNPFSTGLSSSCQQFLIENEHLKYLNLSGCELKSEGIHMLFTGLAKNKGLISLDISSNDIDDIGIEIIASGIAGNQNLKLLDLSSNKIKNRGGCALANAFKINRTLEDLNLKENSIKNIAGQLFSEVSRYNTNILRLNLEANQINFKYFNEIKQNLAHNKQLHIKNLIPKLKNKLEDMQFDERAIEEIKEQTELRKREREEQMQKLYKLNEKYEEVKYTEYQRFLELENELKSYRETSIELSKSLDFLSLEINKETIRGNNEVNEWFQKIGNEKAACKQLEREKTRLKEEINLKKCQNQSEIDNFKEKVEKEETSKRNAEITLSYIKRKLEEKKLALNAIKHPKVPAREPKTFLASEKLASTKKQNHRIIAIESRTIDSNTPSPIKLRRTKSSGRS
ncbi:PPP1R37_1 [Blepharisma stoltei]|uniref:Leucine Rich Repeat family protein n=1 Tax=Blepharisma stoltei TaxID=1481888 RepID=A0AAU9IBM9_9CILI|nr:unnamed protein product [Blepharisma stoltei]